MSSWNDAISLLKSVNTDIDEEEEVDKGWWGDTGETGTGWTTSGRTGGSAMTSDPRSTPPPAASTASTASATPTSGRGLTRGGGASSPSLKGVAATSAIRRR